MEHNLVTSDDEEEHLLERLSVNEVEDDSTGIIKRLSVTNFMCHDNLTIEFEGNVNFIIGDNGSGKSALFTALIIGLGGSMASTNRGTSIKSLIKTGTSCAIIEITLINREGTLCRDTYGKYIKIERKIYRDGRCTYKLKNEAGKVLKTKKNDILNILDEFNFQVDNPLTFLNQEQTKSFLLSKGEKEMYKFFEKSTLLDKVVKTHNETVATKTSAVNLIKLKKDSVNELERDYFKKKEQLQKHVSTQHLRESLDIWNKKLAWSYVVNLENKLKTIRRKLKQAQKQTLIFKLECDNYDKKEEDFHERIKQCEIKVKNAKEDLNNVVDEFENINKLYQESKEILRNENLQYDATVSKHKELSRSFKVLECRIKRQKQVELNEIGKIKEYESSKNRLQVLKKETETIRLDVKKVDENMNEVLSILEKLTNENRSLMSDERSLKDQITSKETDINNMIASKKNRLRLFGTKMPELVKKIEDGFKHGKFSQLPRGPIGNYISITDPSLTLPVECVLRKFLFSFVVANHSDQKVLTDMMNSLFNKDQVSRMAIYTMKFRSNVYDVSNFRTTHPKYLTVYDLLKVSDVNVMNCLIDIVRIENILVIPDLSEAIDCVQVRKWIKCTKAITAKGDEVYPRKFYSNQYSSKTTYLGEDHEESITECRKKIVTLREGVKSVRNSITALKSQSNMKKQALNQMKATKVELVKKVKKVQLEISKLEMMEKPVQIDWKEVEEEILLHEDKLKKEKEELIRINNQREATKLKLAEKKRNVELMEENVKTRRGTVNGLSEELNVLSVQLKDLKCQQKCHSSKYDKHKNLIIELEKKFELVNQEIKCCSDKAEQVSEIRPDFEESTEDILKTISAIQKKIKKREEIVGDYDTIVEEVKTTEELYLTAKKQIQICRRQLQKIDEILSINLGQQRELVRLLTSNFIYSFWTSVEAFNLKGSAHFDHTKKILHLEVGRSECGKEMKALSGGERSFTTVCFVMSLWQVMNTPLRCLDEFDVFMDIDNRRMAMEVMLRCAKSRPNVQFMFLTPNEIPNLSGDHSIQVWKMPEPDRHKRPR